MTLGMRQKNWTFPARLGCMVIFLIWGSLTDEVLRSFCFLRLGRNGMMRSALNFSFKAKKRLPLQAWEEKGKRNDIVLLSLYEGLLFLTHIVCSEVTAQLVPNTKRRLLRGALAPLHWQSQYIASWLASSLDGLIKQRGQEIKSSKILSCIAIKIVMAVRMSEDSFMVGSRIFRFPGGDLHNRNQGEVTVLAREFVGGWE